MELNCDKPVSSCAFNFNLSPYILVLATMLLYPLTVGPGWLYLSVLHFKSNDQNPTVN